MKKVDENGETLGYLDKDGKLVSEETTLTIGEADGFNPSEDGKTWTKEFEKVEAGTYEIEEKNRPGRKNSRRSRRARTRSRRRIRRFRVIRS